MRNRDMHARGQGGAWVTAGLLLANVLAYAWELRLGEQLDLFLRRWGLVAADLAELARGREEVAPAAVVTLVTSTFLHAGWLHLLVNLVYLAAFGGAVESVLGRARFLGLYLLAGITGGVAHVVWQPAAEGPAIGASGAIAGVIAAHLALFPGATLGTLAPVLFFSSAANLPALLLLSIWLVAQLFSGVASITDTGGMAWWAHVGGFCAGLLLAPILRPRRRRRW